MVLVIIVKMVIILIIAIVIKIKKMSFMVMVIVIMVMCGGGSDIMFDLDHFSLFNNSVVFKMVFRDMFSNILFIIKFSHF